MKNELGRILDVSNIGKNMTEAWETKKVIILTALQSSKLGSVHEILANLEDCDPGQERGWYQDRAKPTDSLA